jgi:uncharacterized ferredoxin-like protein
VGEDKEEDDDIDEEEFEEEDIEEEAGAMVEVAEIRAEREDWVERRAESVAVVEFVLRELLCGELVIGAGCEGG